MIGAKMRFRRKRATPKRPSRLAEGTPWPVENRWARRKIEELVERDEIGSSFWTDETCGEACVIEFSAGGSIIRRTNPDCAYHRTYPLASFPDRWPVRSESAKDIRNEDIRNEFIELLKSMADKEDT